MLNLCAGGFVAYTKCPVCVSCMKIVLVFVVGE